jgi:hypothetical protein
VGFYPLGRQFFPLGRQLYPFGEFYNESVFVEIAAFSDLPSCLYLE